MNLYLKQKVFSWNDKFTVYDELGRDRYYVESELFSWSKKLHIYDLAGNEVAFIQQKLFSFLPRYYVYVGGEEIAEIVKSFNIFRQEYTINRLGWSVHGNYFAHEYEITTWEGYPLVGVSKAWFSWGDAYELRIDPDVDEVTALSVVLVIDACIEAQRS